MSRSKSRSRDLDLVEYMRLVMHSLRLAILAEIIIRAIRTSVSDAANGNGATAVAGASSMHICVPSRGIFGDSEQKLHDILPTALVRSLWF
jgi:hypothetical protein